MGMDGRKEEGGRGIEKLTVPLYSNKQNTSIREYSTFRFSLFFLFVYFYKEITLKKKK